MNSIFGFGFFNGMLLVTLLLGIRFVRVGSNRRWTRILHRHRSLRRIIRVRREGGCSFSKIIGNIFPVCLSALSLSSLSSVHSLYPYNLDTLSLPPIHHMLLSRIEDEVQVLP